MRLIYPDVGNCRALIIDANAALRSMQAQILRDMGVGDVVQASRPANARRVLETRAFDIVLCDYHFDNDAMTGQDLLDELRRAQLLPYSTVFIMVTDEASYAMVAEAAESALDGYLLKPHTAQALAERLIQARRRKSVLLGVFGAIEAGEFAKAARLCRARFDARAELAFYAARIGAELHIRAGDPKAACRLYEDVLAVRPLPWAQLGVARAQLESGQLHQAGQTLASLIAEQADFADAHDLLGRVQLEQGNLDAALDTYRSAVRITPHSITRLQKQGMLAFLLGESDEAMDVLERSVRLRLGSKMFDCQALVLLGLIQLDKGDAKAVACNHDRLTLMQQRQPENVRLQRFVVASEIVKTFAEGSPQHAVAQVARLAAEIGTEDFDFEAAGNLLALLSRLHRAAVAPADTDAWVVSIAQRFCVSKASADMLCRAAQGHPPLVALIRAGHARISDLAEQAIAHSANGAPEAAVKNLLARGSETRNAKLVDLASMVLARHADRIDGSADMTGEINALRRRFCGKGAQLALGGGVGRAAGALNLRD
jgi:DNA-binding response OmpR family regulator/Tfp pilus assembly protein PilF